MLIKIIQENGVDVDGLIDKWNNEIELEEKEGGGESENTKSVDIEMINRIEKMEKERAQYDAHISLLNEQIAIKDKRMDEQAERFNRKDEQYTELVNRLLNCHCCGKGE